MELLQLRYFYESACQENISRTAERYMVPPSSVSLAIKRLEAELGCTLFDRTGNRIRLNENGRLLQKALETALRELDDATAQLRQAEQTGSREIHLLIRSERQYLLDRVSQFRKACPEVSFRVSHDFTTGSIERFDIIVDAVPEGIAGFEGVPIIRERIYIAASEENPLCDRELTMRDLQDQPFIVMGKGNSMHRIAMDCCRKAGFSPNIIIESDDPYYVRKYIELNFGIAFVPEISWQGQMGGTRWLNVTDLFEQRVTYAFLNRTRPLSSTVMAFYEMLLEKRTIA